MVQPTHTSSAVIDPVDTVWSPVDDGPVSEETYRRVALEDPERHWELHDGLLVEKPGMGMEHNDIMTYLVVHFAPQLDGSVFRLRVNSARLRLPTGRYYIPDLAIIPTEDVLRLAGRPGELEFYDGPVPLVVELWSPSTGGYDVNTKLPNYQRRGDLEIWRLQPYEHRLTAWTRQANGNYAETAYTEGVVRLTSLPGVEVNLDALFNVQAR